MVEVENAEDIIREAQQSLREVVKVVALEPEEDWLLPSPSAGTCVEKSSSKGVIGRQRSVASALMRWHLKPPTPPNQMIEAPTMVLQIRSTTWHRERQ